MQPDAVRAENKPLECKAILLDALSAVCYNQRDLVVLFKISEGEAMLLPCAEQAVIEVAKLRDYLLSSSHPVGRFKAVFFETLGYKAENWRQLEADLRLLVQSNDAELSQSNPYGRKYEVRGMLGAVATKRVAIVTVWIIRIGEDVPRFVTAYPGERP